MKKNIILGVTGSVAAVMLFRLIDELEKDGFKVKLVATGSAWLFIFSVLIRKPQKIFKLLALLETGLGEITGVFSKEKGKVRHINLVKWADLMLIAPASANTISKITHAIADNYLTTIALAMPENKKIFIAPAMNVEMWNNPFFRENMEKLRKEKMRYSVIEPAAGKLQCGDEGMGKMADIRTIVERVSKGRA
ncbi:MAG: flavoprotein [Candidatus Paceibacterota bacterium]|jgi:phosphopantothenoylcysteine synthetase/decarboxylase